jgi:hypothetical protein
MSTVLRRINDNRLAFLCPGCNEEHVISYGPGETWGWNSSMTAPTFTPSVLVRSGHYVDGQHPCWCDYNAAHPGHTGMLCYICHSFVTDGRIQFLGDCTHKLAGMTVDLPEWPKTTPEAS